MATAYRSNLWVHWISLTSVWIADCQAAKNSLPSGPFANFAIRVNRADQFDSGNSTFKFLKLREKTKFCNRALKAAFKRRATESPLEPRPTLKNRFRFERRELFREGLGGLFKLIR